jgi:coenzyme F420 hydrogenase subunit beta
VAACPSDSIGTGEDELPTLVKMCTGCSLCWDFCPRAGLRYEATWKITGAGPSEGPSGEPERYTARVIPRVDGAQDGGVVTALLSTLLESGQIDGALLARPSEREPWKGEAFLAQTPAEVAACAGSFYNQTMALGHLDLKGYRLPPRPRIALVGTPCEIQGLRAMQARPWVWGASRVDAVVLTVALLCTKSFNYQRLMVEKIQRDRGIRLEAVGKVDILHGKLLLYGLDGGLLLEEPIQDFHGAALKGCDECADFLGRAADISVGSVGSADGYSSVLIRTEAGRRAFAALRPRLEIRELDRPQALDKLEALDKRVAFASLQRPFDPAAPLFIDYETHLAGYQGTDRAPVDHDPVRY